MQIEVELLDDPLNDGELFQTARKQSNRRNAYALRPFLAIDGEGVTEDNRHSYVLFGAATDTAKQSIAGSDLSTAQCFRFLIDMEIQYPHHIKVAFALDYDVNMMIKDVAIDQLERLTKGEWSQYGLFKFKWLKNKWFELRYKELYIKVYDTFTFFGCSFLLACKQYLGDEPELLEVTEGKALRSIFEFNELDTLIRPYMYKELTLMVKLITQLRTLLSSIDINVGGWHGPGAIATALLTKHSIKKYRPKEEIEVVRDAAQYAYFGGRFESFKTGRLKAKVYQYDIRSAYPYALTMCPTLDNFFYTTKIPADIPDFALCHVTYFNLDNPRTSINPLPLRSSKQAVYYPGAVSGWIWGCEYKIAKKWFREFIELHEVMQFNDDGTRPFDFINDLFQKRAAWQVEKNPVQLACKLGMNSVYGKLAQRIGWNQEEHTAPAFHQLRWAGFVTAKCRSMVLDAMMQAPDKIIAVETDGIFSEVPLDLDEGKGLGQWESTTYDEIVFMQSGVYFTLNGADWSKGKTRGFSANKANIDLALSALDGLQTMRTVQHQFHALPARLGKSDWRTWTDHDHLVQWGGGGKRAHIQEHCPGCTRGEQWHNTAWSIPMEFLSHKHPLPWLEP